MSAVFFVTADIVLTYSAHAKLFQEFCMCRMKNVIIMVKITISEVSMAGSIKWFVYTTDGGTDYAIKLDESNTEAVNGGTQDFVTGLTLTVALPRNIKPREVFYTNTARTRTIRCVCLTQTIYNGIVAGGVPTITDPIAGTGTLGLIRANGERIQLPVPLDTGLDDGDAT